MEGVWDKAPLVQAIQNYEPQQQSDLAFVQGDIIRIISKPNQDWFEGELNGKTGIFPAVLVRPFNPKKMNRVQTKIFERINFEKYISREKNYNPLFIYFVILSF